MKDRLQDIFDKQKAFNSKLYTEIYDVNCPTSYKESVSKDMAFSAIRELTELIDEMNWKRHQLIRKDVNMSNVLEEAIDVLKFYLNILIIWGFTADDLYREFLRKSEVVEQKWNQEQMLSKISKDDRVVCVDIDDVLGDYTEWFLNYSHKWLLDHDREKYKLCWDNKIKTISQLITTIGRETYNKMKHDYRNSGIKAQMPVNTGARELLDYLNVKSYKIILLSARPYKDYNRIWADTLEWLKVNNLHFHAILFDRDKEDLVTKLFPNMEYFIDDHKGNIEKVSQAGFKCIYVGCNLDIDVCTFGQDPKVRCVRNLEEVKGFIEYENSSSR